MPFNLSDLRERRTKLFTDASAVLAGVTGDITSEIRTKYDGMIADIDLVDADIARLERMEREQAEQRSRPANRPQPGTPESRDAEIRSSFRNYLATGTVETRDLTVGLQGVLIPQLFSGTVISAQKSYGEIYQLVHKMFTDNGNPMKIALDNDTGNGLVSVAVGVQDVAEVDPPTAGEMLNVGTYSTGIVKVDNGLLTDAGFDVESWLRDKFLARFYRGASNLIVNGDNAAVASLLTAYASVGVTSATIGKIGYADFVAMIAALDPAYQLGAVFAMSNATLGAVLNIMDGNGRPIFLPGFGAADSGFVGTILGYPVKLVTQLPAVATGNVPVLFGQFSEGYTWRQQGKDIAVIRLNERYAATYETGFVGFTRVGGIATDAGTHPILALTIK